MTEASFVDTLTKLGIGKGPAFGIKKTLVCIPTTIILGTLVGWFFGNFIF